MTLSNLFALRYVINEFRRTMADVTPDTSFRVFRRSSEQHDVTASARDGGQTIDRYVLDTALLRSHHHVRTMRLASAPINQLCVC